VCGTAATGAFCRTTVTKGAAETCSIGGPATKAVSTDLNGTVACGTIAGCGLAACFTTGRVPITGAFLRATFARGAVNTCSVG
jgi:hypothetical protein